MFTKWQIDSLFIMWTICLRSIESKGGVFKLFYGKKVEAWHTASQWHTATWLLCIFGNFMEIFTKFSRKSLFQKEKNLNSYFFPYIKWYPYWHISVQVAQLVRAKDWKRPSESEQPRANILESIKTKRTLLQSFSLKNVFGN